MNRLYQLMSFYKRDEKGGVLILVALLFIGLIGMAALAIDVGQMYQVRREMVSAADAAALAGALETKSNENFARNSAELYATKYNNADEDLFDKDDDVRFTGDGDGRIISVRTSKEVHYYFAQVLGIGPSTIVSFIASAQVGPGNSLTPFVDVAWPFEGCPCYPECTCEVDEDDCDCGHDPDDPDSECTCDPECPCESGCTCNSFIYTNRCEDNHPDPDDGDRYYMRAGDDRPARYGDHFELHYERWQNWDGYTSGVFPYLRLGDMSGGSDLEEAIAGGYDGTLEQVKPGTIHRAETGQTHGGLKSGLATRIQVAGENHCKTPEDLPEDYYTCDLVIIIPLVTHHDKKDYKIVGYASVLLDLVEYGGEKYVWAYFLEYLSFEQLKNILDEDLDGFVIRLVSTPEGVF